MISIYHNIDNKIIIIIIIMVIIIIMIIIISIMIIMIMIIKIIIIIIYMIKEGLSVCLSVCMYPSIAHSFGPIGMKLGMDTPWDPGNDMG